MINELMKNVMNLGIITADDVKRLTATELMTLIIERSNGLLNYVEGVDEKLVNLLQTIKTITVEELNKWTQDGTFDALINETALATVNKRIDETNAQLSQLRIYSILDGEVGVVDLRFPYGHVNRYGADPTGQRDSSTAIQNAVDTMENLGKTQKGIHVIKFDSGNYLVEKTILVKSKDGSHYSRPLAFEGVQCKYLTGNVGHGTVITPKIKHNGQTHANLFAINNRYSDGVDEDVVFHKITGDSATDPIMDNISFRNMAIINADDTLTINVIKGYRFRCDIENIYVSGCNMLVEQPANDRVGMTNVCDFSSYRYISSKGMKTGLLNLAIPDLCVIEKIVNHYPSKSFKFLIKLYGGNSIKLTSIHSAFHFIENTTIPHNLGTGKNGTNAFIKMIGCNTVNVSEVYIERQILDYAYHVYASSNITINQHKDVFFGNGLLRLEDSRLVTLSNIIRDCNLVTDYDDIYQDGEYKSKNVSLSKILGRNFYSETLSLDSDVSKLNRVTPSPRNITMYYKKEQRSQLNLEKAKLECIYYTGNFVVKNELGETLTGVLTHSFGDNSIKIVPANGKVPVIIRNVSEAILADGSVINHTPVLAEDGETVYFISKSTNALITQLDSKIRFFVEVEMLKK